MATTLTNSRKYITVDDGSIITMVRKLNARTYYTEPLLIVDHEISTGTTLTPQQLFIFYTAVTSPSVSSAYELKTIVDSWIEDGTQSFTSITISNVSSSGTSQFSILSASTIYLSSTDIATQLATTASTLSLQNQLTTKVNKSGDTMTGQLITIALSATTLSGATIYSGSTELGSLFSSSALGTSLQNQLNTKVNKSGDTITGQLTATAISATTLSATTFYSGTTLLSTLLGEANTASNLGTGTGIFSSKVGIDLQFKSLSAGTGIDITAQSSTVTVTFTGNSNSSTTTIDNGLNTYTGGTSLFQKVNVSGLTIDNINLSGDSRFITLSATTLSGGTIYSGTTEISTLFASSNLGTSLQSQLNTKVNKSGDTMTGQLTTIALSSTTISGATIYSGSSEIGNLFNSLYGNKSDVTTLQNQITTKVNKSGDTMTGQLTTIALSATTLSAGTIYSGTTELSTLFSSNASVGILQNQMNSKVDRSGDTMTGQLTTIALSATTLSAGTIYSGSSEIGNLFNSLYGNKSDVTTLQNQMNTKVNKSGDTMTGQLTTNALYATTLSGGTLYSGSSLLESIFAVTGLTISQDISIFSQKAGGTLQFRGISAGTGIAVTQQTSAITITYTGTSSTGGATVDNGLNTYTGGTSAFQKVNISGLTIDNINASGNSRFISLSAATLSGGTIYSGETEISTLFSSAGLGTSLQSQLNTKVNKSGDTMTDQLTVTSLLATRLSGTTIYSGTSEIGNIFHGLYGNKSDVTTLQNQITTKVNRSGDTMTGALIGVAISGTSISATTFYSGSTELSTLFGSGSGEVNTASNIGTGIGLFAQKSGVDLQFRSLSAGTGIGITQQTSAVTITYTGTSSGGGGATVDNGLNTYTGGTSSFQKVNISGLTIDNINSSGNSIFVSLSATSLSGGTIYSGNTELSSLFESRIHYYSVKTTHQTLSGVSHTSLGLAFPVGVSQRWTFEINVPQIFATSSGIRSQFVFPVGAEFRASQQHNTTTQAGFSNITTLSSATETTAAFNTFGQQPNGGAIRIIGYISLPSTTSGTVDFQWRNLGSASTIFAGAYVNARRIN